MTLYSKFNISKKIAIVVGGSGQLGSSTIKILLEANCLVINLDLYEKNKINNKNYFFFKLNITKEKQVNSVKKKIKKKFKKIDILINHSHFKGHNKKLIAHNDFFSDLIKYPTNMWKMAMDVNLNGMFFVTKYFLPLLLKNKKSVIVNTSSTYGKVSPNKNIYGKTGISCPISYSTSKFAIIGFTKYLATHYADQGLRANTLVPGGIKNSSHLLYFKKNYSKNTPLKRLSNQDDYKEAMLFLVSDASSYMTGSELIVDGGWTAW